MRQSLRRFARAAVLATAALGLVGPAHAKLVTQELPYTATDGTKLVGYYAYDDAKVKKGKKIPGVIVVHEWWGLNDYARGRAEMLAKKGYAALAVDMYGDGKTTMSKDEAGMMMHGVIDDPKVSAARANAGLDLLKAQPQVDASRIAAIGYCFGGKIVLDMARQGAPLRGVISVHGALATATPAKKGVTTARVLVQHGGADSMVGLDQLDALKREFDAAGVNYEAIVYPGAKHAFSSPAADKLGRENGMDIGYDANVDKVSWKKDLSFLKEVLR